MKSLSFFIPGKKIHIGCASLVPVMYQGSLSSATMVPNVRADYHEEYSSENLLQEDCHHVYALPLPFHRFTGIASSGFSSFTQSGARYPELQYSFMLLSTLIEDWSTGTPSFNCSTKDRNQYAKWLYMSAAEKMGRLEPKDRLKLKAKMAKTVTFYPEVAKLYADIFKDLGSTEIIGDSNPLTHRPVAGSARSQDNAPEPVIRKRPVPDTEFCFFAEQRGQSGWNINHAHEEVFGRPFQLPTSAHHSQPFEEDDDEAEIDVIEGEDGDDCEPDKTEQDDGGGKPNNKPWSKFKLPDMTNAETQEMVKIFYVPIKKKVRDIEEPLVGYIMVVLQKDPNWNPGVALQKIMSVPSAERGKLYPKLSRLKKYEHPIHWMNKNSLALMAKKMRVANKEGVGILNTDTQARLQGVLDHIPMYNEQHPCHPKHWANFKAALLFMEKFGADPELMRYDRWVSFDKETRTYTFTLPYDVVAYSWPMRYHRQGDYDYAGIFHHVWPHDKKVGEAMRSKMLEGDPIGVGYQDEKPVISTLMRDLEKEQRRNGAAYKTPDILQHLFFKNKKLYNEVMPTLPFDPRIHPQKYEEYCVESKKHAKHFMTDFHDNMRPNAHVTEPVSILIDYAYKNIKGDITVPLFFVDPNMDSWGNYVARVMYVYRKQWGVEEPLVSFLTQFAWATYDFKSKYPLPQIMVCGPPGVGKSFPVLRMTENTCVPGTTKELHHKSNLADTAGHEVDTIILQDEGDDFKQDAKSGSKTNLNKVAYDNGVLASETLTWVPTDSGVKEKVKITELSMHNKVTFVATNFYEQDIDRAVSDRFMIFVKSKSTIDTVILDDTGISLRSAPRFHRLQIACMYVYKAIMVKAIPDVDIKIYHYVMGRMLAFLKHMGVGDGSEKSTTRTHRKILGVLRHYTVINAIQQAMNLPGGLGFCDPDWRKTLPFKVSPYLYPTKQLFLWSLLILRRQWINEHFGHILQAAVSVANLRYDDKSKIEDFLQSDPDNLIHWKFDMYDDYGNIINQRTMVANAGQQGAPVSVGNEATNASRLNATKKFDLNYVELTISPALYTMIRSKLPPSFKFENDFIEKQLKILANKYTFRPFGGRIKPVTREEIDNFRNTGQLLPREPLEKDESMFIVKKEHGKYYIAPEACDKFRQELLIRAFLYSLFNGYMKPQKYVLPIAVSSDRRELMDVMTITKQQIIKMVKDYKTQFVDFEDVHPEDRFPGNDVFGVEASASAFEQSAVFADPVAEVSMPGGGKEKEEDVGDLIHDPVLAKELENLDYNSPLPRRLGLSFEKQYYVKPEAMDLLVGQKEDPNMSEEYWDSLKREFMNDSSKKYLHIYKEDIDDYCARKRHYLCGISLKIPVMTQHEVRKRYNEAVQDLDAFPETPRQINYPKDLKENKKADEKQRKRELIAMEFIEKHCNDIRFGERRRRKKKKRRGEALTNRRHDKRRTTFQAPTRPLSISPSLPRRTSNQPQAPGPSSIGFSSTTGFQYI